MYLFLIKTSENYTQNQMDRKDINKKENNIEYNNIILGILMKFFIFNSCILFIINFSDLNYKHLSLWNLVNNGLIRKELLWMKTFSVISKTSNTK